MSEHRTDVDWLIHNPQSRGPKVRSWRLRCSCGYRGGWVSQQRGPLSKSKAEVAALNGHQ